MAVSDRVFLPTSEHLAVVAERSEVGGSRCRRGGWSGVPTLFERVCVPVVVQAVDSVFSEYVGGSGR